MRGQRGGILPLLEGGLTIPSKSEPAGEDTTVLGTPSEVLGLAEEGLQRKLVEDDGTPRGCL